MSALGCLCGCWSLVASAVLEDRPCDPGQLIGNGGLDHAGWTASQQGIDPSCQKRGSAAGMPHQRAGTQHQQAPQVPIPLLGDVSQPHFAARSALSRHQADPSGQVPARTERPRVRDGGRKRAGRDDANPWNRLQTLAQLVRAMPGQDLVLDLTDPGMGILKLGDDQADAPPRPRAWARSAALEGR